MGEPTVEMAAPFAQNQVPGVLGSPFRRRLVRDGRAVADGVEGDEPVGEAGFGECVGRLDRMEQQHIVVEIDVVLTQPGNPVQAGADDMRIEGGQVFKRNDVLMPDQGNPAVFLQPDRNLPVRNDVDVVDPWREAFDRAEGVPQLLMALEPGVRRSC